MLPSHAPPPTLSTLSAPSQTSEAPKQSKSRAEKQGSGPSAEMGGGFNFGAAPQPTGGVGLPGGAQGDGTNPECKQN